MSFEKPKPKDHFEIAGQITGVILNLSVGELEKAIRSLPVDQREKLLNAVEISKTATSSLA